MALRKRDKAKQRRASDRERKWLSRHQVRPHPRKQCLRAPQAAGTLRRIKVGPRKRGGGGRIPLWTPTARSVVELDGTDERTVIGVNAADVPRMLQHLAPRLLRATGALLARRAVRGSRARRGAGIILTASKSSSGPHADGEDTLLLNLSGSRQVWYAAPAAVGARVKRTQDRPGAPTFLPPAHDPTCNPPRRGVQWEAPVTLKAGDAMWIGAGWWHCVAAERGGVAVPLEVQSGSVRGEAPRVFEHVAPRKRESGHSDRLVSRRVHWGSDASVCRLWAGAIAGWEM